MTVFGRGAAKMRVQKECNEVDAVQRQVSDLANGVRLDFDVESVGIKRAG